MIAPNTKPKAAPYMERSIVKLVGDWSIHLDELRWSPSTHAEHKSSVAANFKCPEEDCRVWMAVVPSTFQTRDGTPSPELVLVMAFGKVSTASYFKLARKVYMNAELFAQMFVGIDDNRQADHFPYPTGSEEWLYTAGEYQYGRLDDHLLTIHVSEEFAATMTPTGPGEAYRDHTPDTTH